MKIDNKHNAPASLIRFAEKRHYDAGKSDYTATSLIGSPKIRMLERKHSDSLRDDPYEQPWKYFSTAFHHLISLAAEGEDVAEERLFTTIDGLVVSGAIDLQTISYTEDLDKIVTIGDYKLCTVYALKDTLKFEQQLNIYAWLVERCDPTATVDKLEIYCFLRDWQISRSERDPNYPRTPAITVEIPLWSFEDREKFVKDRIKVQEAAKKKIPDCTHEERWPTESVWKIKKKGGTRAIPGASKLRSMKAAEQALGALEKPEDHEVVYSFGTYRRCQNFCAVSQWCEQWKEFKESEEQ